MHEKDRDSAGTEEKTLLEANCRYSQNSYGRILLYVEG